MTGETQQQDVHTWSVGYGYDANASPASLAYPAGLTVDFAPNALGQPTQVSSSTRTYASGVSYFPNGAIRQFTYGNGIVHTMEQNARQLLQRVTSSGGVLNYDYAFDMNGNVERIHDLARGDAYNRWMQYDGLDRLTAAGSPSFGGDHWHRYTYDALDNLKSWQLSGVKDHADYYYEAGTHRLINIRNSAGAAVVGLDYDVQGNVTHKNGQGYVFDYGNRLRQTVNKDGYRYDAHGRRVLSHSAASKMFSMYGAGGTLLWERDERNNKRTQHLYLAGTQIAQRTRPLGSDVETVTYQHTDALGSPVAMTNTSGQVVERTAYEPYGAAIGKTVQGVGYTGHVMDAATGLIHMQQRYYDPEVGRFLSVDPITANGNTGANFNRYKYAANNPYRFTDPDGRQEREQQRDWRSMTSRPGLSGANIQTIQVNSGSNERSSGTTGTNNTTGNVQPRPGVVIKDERLQGDLEGLSSDLGGQEIDVISGYRDQSRQNALRAAGNKRAAKSSHHTHGVAADIKVNGMSNSDLGRAAYESGRFERVNVYSDPAAGVHVDYLDVGPGTQMYRDWKRVEP